MDAATQAPDNRAGDAWACVLLWYKLDGGKAKQEKVLPLQGESSDQDPMHTIAIAAAHDDAQARHLGDTATHQAAASCKRGRSDVSVPPSGDDSKDAASEDPTNKTQCVCVHASENFLATPRRASQAAKGDTEAAEEDGGKE